MVKELPVVWLQTACCTGCSVSLLNSASPTIKNILIDPVIPGVHINLIFHATIMAGAGEPVIKVLEDTATKRKGMMFWLLREQSPLLLMVTTALLANVTISRLICARGWKI
jgi:Ni,Fe-hydrogenase I small subunit